MCSMSILKFAMPGIMNLSNINLIDFSNFLELLIRFSLNMTVLMILVRWLYYSTTRRKDYLFTYFLLSNLIFLLCYLLSGVKLQMGFALGLFAVFGIIRYRTNSIPIREMTYLFLTIGISIINALASTDTSVVDVLFTNIIIILLAYGLEKVWLLKNESSKTIIYEKINLILPEKHQELLNDLQVRTGIRKINRIEIGKIDFLKDTCTLQIFYDAQGNQTSSADHVSDYNDDDDD
jgi:hypothetical protein